MANPSSKRKVDNREQSKQHNEVDELNLHRPIVLLTGFGPFGIHQVNASWETVKLLDGTIVAGCIIRAVEIPVSYDYVTENVRQLWRRFEPKLVIHVGVSSYARNIQLEDRACRTGYYRNDAIGNQCKTYGFCSGEEFIRTGIDLTALADYVRDNCNKHRLGTDDTEAVKVCVSMDAGRYLCEYTYYASLSVDHNRTVFVHVPPLDRPYTAPTMAEVLRWIIRGSINQIDAKECTANNFVNK